MKENLRHGNRVQVQTKRATKALCSSRKQNEIDDASFDLLPDTFRKLAEQNPGTVSEVVVERGRFSMAFICPGMRAESRSHRPKLLALDAAHGKSSFKGVVMLATALDGAGHIFPVAFGFPLPKRRKRGRSSSTTSPTRSTFVTSRSPSSATGARASTTP